MPIISQQTWDNMPDKEKSDFRKLYKEKLSNAKDAYERGFIDLSEKIENEAKDLESYFGKENLQPKPKTPKTWEDIEKDNINWSNIDIDRLNTLDAITPKMRNKLIATLKISKLIEIAYGSMVTDEEYILNEYSTEDDFWGIWVNAKGEIECTKVENCRDLLVFHTQQQAEEFMSYPENLQLIKDYYMI